MLYNKIEINLSYIYIYIYIYIWGGIYSCIYTLLLLLFYSLRVFFTSVLADGLSLKFEWSQVSRTLLSILADLSSMVVWMISIHPLISKSSSLFNNTPVIVPRAPIIIGINVTSMFHSFFNPLARSRYHHHQYL